MGRLLRGEGMPLLTFNPCKNGNFFGSFHFCLSSCRHSVDSLSGSASRGKRSRRLQKNPCGNVPIRMGRLLRGEGMPLLTFNPCKNGNFFGSFHFCLSSCRHSVDSLSGSASRGKRSRRLFYTRHRGRPKLPASDWAFPVIPRCRTAGTSSEGPGSPDSRR